MGRARADRNWTGRSPSVRTRDCIYVRTVIRKVRHQERAVPPDGRLAVDAVNGPIGHETGTVISATDANATWPFAIAAEAIEYWRRSFDESYAFLRRLTRVQKLDDVIEMQSEVREKCL